MSANLNLALNTLKTIHREVYGKSRFNWSLCRRIRFPELYKMIKASLGVY